VAGIRSATDLLLNDSASQLASRCPAYPQPGLRTVGVEEEFLLVDSIDGRPIPVAGALAALGTVTELPADQHSLEPELQQEQLETATAPCRQLPELGAQLRMLRRQADGHARTAGARLAALATSPLPVRPHLTPRDRYRAISRHLGLTCAEQLTCGCHVHVAVASDEEGVAVLDRIRPWLAVLTALTNNSPFWNGNDTGYAGYRTQAWNRWPGTGPTELFGSAAAYHDVVGTMLGTGTPLDGAMIYFDARLSRSYPTVEIRVADVCLDVEDVVLLAALSRALVDTAVAEWQAGVPADPVCTTVLRLASWRASRFGLDGPLVHPRGQRLSQAADVVRSLLQHLRPALTASGDLDLVEARLEHLLQRGTGASRQRQVARASGELSTVVADAVERTCA
jgi:glutamate---cysteine ligase / carboxylate-amine ligase